MTYAVRTTYYTFGGQRVAMRQNNAVYWLHGDHLGSASLTTNITGAVMSEMRYYPFGETRWVSGTLPTDRLFTGQRAENSSLLGSIMDYGARMYSPMLGRFISADTLVPVAGDPQAYNRYAYTRNSPMRYTDPDGHYWWDAVRNANDIKDASTRNNLPALAVAATIDVQSNGWILDPVTEQYGTNKSFGPGQVTQQDAHKELGRDVSIDELRSQPNINIDIRAKTLARKDQVFQSMCGSNCSKQMMTQDRWLVFALAGNGQGVDPKIAWEKGDSNSFDWDSYFKASDSTAGTHGIMDFVAFVGEQQFRSRDRYLLSQFANALQNLSGYGIPLFNLFDAPGDLGETIRFLRCMSNAGATTGGCR